MKWLRKNDTRLILTAMLLFTTLLLVVSCQGGEATPAAIPAISAPQVVNTCLSCHSDQDQVMALALEPEALEAESSGEG